MDIVIPIEGIIVAVSVLFSIGYVIWSLFCKKGW